jgi:hypothetical protein
MAEQVPDPKICVGLASLFFFTISVLKEALLLGVS